MLLIRQIKSHPNFYSTFIRFKFYFILCLIPIIIILTITVIDDYRIVALSLSSQEQKLTSITPSLPSQEQKLTSITPSLPKLILHIGPRKTATTYIQNLLSKANNAQVLAKDSFVYLNKFKLCLLEHVKCSNDSLTKTENKLHELKMSGTNVIISDENLPNRCAEENCGSMLKDKLKGWDVRVVMTYRRYFELLVSEYDQRCKRAKGVNMDIKSFDKFYSRLEHNKLFHPSSPTLLKIWKDNFEDVRVFNMYDHSVDYDMTSTAVVSSISNGSRVGDLFTSFICKIIPEAKHTCELLKNGTFSISIAPSMGNKSENKVSAEALLTTITLLKRKLIDFTSENQKTYFKVANIIDEFISSCYKEQVGTYFYKEKPFICLAPNDLNKILNITIEYEKELLPFFYNETGADAIKLSFDKAVYEKKFCQLNVPKFVDSKQGELLRVLESINGLNINRLIG